MGIRYQTLLLFTLTILGTAFFADAGSPISPDSPEKQSFVYPYSAGQLSFPQDEGRHLFSDEPFTLVEWFANYSHLTADDGSRYFLFTTFVTFDPVEKLVQGKFPHEITTLVDVSNSKSYHSRDLAKLKTFATGHAHAETAAGNFFRWKGSDKPFCYDYHVVQTTKDVEYAVDLDLTMVKPPLVINGSGFIHLPKGTSGYYSQTRLKASGVLRINGVEKKVQGIHWVDRQWLGASFAGNLQYTYEWWALQLDNNEEAILFRVWDSATNLVAMTRMEINHADGTRELIDQFDLKDQQAGWHLTAPKVGWDLDIAPACEGQRVWKSCDVTGTIKGEQIKGMAVAELARDVVQAFSQRLNLSGDPDKAKTQPDPAKKKDQ